MNKIIKSIKSHTLNKIVKIKSYFVNNTNKQYSFSELLEKTNNYKEIVVICNGPSANKVINNLSKDKLYLVTNSGNEIVGHLPHLYYINDGYYVKRSLIFRKIVNKSIYTIFYYDDNSDKKGVKYFLKYKKLLQNDLIIFSNQTDHKLDTNNYEEFKNFYSKRNLEIKIQNSGFFLLLLGYYLAYNNNIPLKIYGLDLGIGGVKHYNNKGIIGKSITRDRIKLNAKKYLDFMYKEFDKIENYSNFNSNV